MEIPFIKAHGAHNDFLLTWRDQLPSDVGDLARLARAICSRNCGVGADGWILLSPFERKDDEKADAAIDLWNSDGSRSEISGNGTRCAAAVLVEEDRHSGSSYISPASPVETVHIATGAGVKTLTLLNRRGQEFLFRMNMGAATIEELHSTLVPDHDAIILNVGNPQCAVLVENFDFDWRSLGAELERHPRFPNRTNVSFVRVADPHTIDVRFFERGAGETMSSGTGSTGAVAAALARGLVESPVRVLTPAGPLDIQMINGDLYLAGPAEIVAEGKFHYATIETDA